MPGGVRQERLCARHIGKVLRRGLKCWRARYPGVHPRLFVPRIDYLLREDFQASVLTGVLWGV